MRKNKFIKLMFKIKKLMVLRGRDEAIVPFFFSESENFQKKNQFSIVLLN